MATLQQLEQALVNADKAGDADAARRLAAAVQAARADSASRIPGAQADMGAAVTPREQPGIVDRVIGAGEAALSTATGATTGMAGGVLNFIGVLGEELARKQSGQYLDDAAVKRINEAFGAGQRAGTYAPRTEAGQDALGVVADVGAALTPLAGLTGELGLIAQAGRAARTGAPAATTARAAAEGVARDVAGPAAAAGVGRAIDATGAAAAAGPKAVAGAYKQASDRITQAFGMSAETGRRDGASVGAAGTERAIRLQETSQQLPVPVQLRQGELTGDIEQLRFEQQQARGSMGEPLRAQAAKANRALSQNVEAVADATGAETASNLEAGRVISKALANGKARAEAAERAAWQAADKSGAASEIVPVDALVSYIRENAFARDRLPILTVIERKLKMMDAASGSLAGDDFTPGNITLKGLQEVRKSINKFVDESNGADVGAGKAMKRIIDDITENVGDDLYRAARNQTIRKEQLYGNNAVVRDLIKLRKGTTDRAVALEDVYKNTILQGSADDLTMLKRTLSVSDQHAGFKPGTNGPGAQAWRELQGATVRDLLKKATSNNGIDFEGGQAFSSAAYSRALRQLDENGKLRQILGPKQAQTLRDIDEIARAVKVLPPGTVSSSGSAEALMLAVAEGSITGLLTGVPAPVLSTLKAGAQAIRDRKTRARIMASLNYRPSGQTKP